MFQSFETFYLFAINKSPSQYKGFEPFGGKGFLE
jgi:hypothetical protein